MTFVPGRDNFSQRKEKFGLCPDLISETIFSGPTIRLYDEVQLNQCSRNSLIALAPFPPGYGKSFPAYFRPDKPIGRAGLGPGARTKIKTGDRRCGQRICVCFNPFGTKFVSHPLNPSLLPWQRQQMNGGFFFYYYFFLLLLRKSFLIFFLFFFSHARVVCVCGGRTQLCHRCLDKRNRKCVSRTEWIKASKRVRECGLISQILSFLLFVLLSQKVTSSQNFVVGVGMFAKLPYGCLCMGN